MMTTILKSSFCIFSGKISFISFLLLLNIVASAQKIDTSRNRVSTDVKVAFPYAGSVKFRSTQESTSSNWLLGCETLDRDMADYEQYKAYLAPLGIKRIRLQAGWAKTEKIKGQYDWAWLDRIINDAVSRGIQPWLETSYGNPIYPGGGGINLSAGVPVSPEALKAWDKWVAALVTRYKVKVKEWEIWNEPNFGDNTINTPQMVADLNIRTADIIKRIQPDAKISGLSMGHIDLEYANTFFKVLYQKKKLGLFDNMTYHDYVYNPDANYAHVAQLRRILDQYAPGVKLRQGENGSPSFGGAGRGALGDYDWSELTQAKWNTRRMLSDLGHDIECSILGIIDMNYASVGSPITKLNVKGIIESDSTKRAVKPKMAYYAMQNVASIFDNSLKRIKSINYKFNKNLYTNNSDTLYVTKSTDRSYAIYGYENVKTGKQIFTIWSDEAIPSNQNIVKKLNFTFSSSNIDKPVWVDVLTGNVHDIPADKWRKVGNRYEFDDIPVYDSPILIADKSLIKLR